MKPCSFALDSRNQTLRCEGVDVIVFSEHNPAQHQSGITLIMNDVRVAACGDLRFEPTPGQFQPSSCLLERKTVPETGAMIARLSYPDEKNHLKGFNPTLAPDFAFSYTVTAVPEDGGVRITVDLDRAVPDRFLGKLRFNLELVPGRLFGRSWLMDSHSGIFPRQPGGPTESHPANALFSLPVPDGRHADPDRLTGAGKGFSPLTADTLNGMPLASGRRFTCCPEDDLSRFTVISENADLELYDGRMNHNNGWFVLSSALPAEKTAGALSWLLLPAVDPDYRYAPVIQISQIGYHPDRKKIAYVETDRRSEGCHPLLLERITPDGPVPVAGLPVKPWGAFLRYNYYTGDFSSVREEGLYRLRCGGSLSPVFPIASDVLDRGVWQPVLEYFLPVQMCHMRVSEKYRVWHGLCHMDDARMAPVNYNHFDGYVQGPDTLTRFRSGDPVPGLNAGGWHDAGDYDLRVESQAGDVYLLALAREEFGVYWDETTVDQASHTVEIHQPDGKNDLLQQVEHGLLTVVGGYNALGRLYRGIICSDLRQYVLLGDASVMTDGIPGNGDDRWVFTEDHPRRELTVAGQLAAASRVMRGFNDALGARALEVAEELFAVTNFDRAETAPFFAAAELYLTTGKQIYRDFLTDHTGWIRERPQDLAWVAARVFSALKDPVFTETLRAAVRDLLPEMQKMLQASPYGVPYIPRDWGNGWVAETFACRYYWICKAFPDLCPEDPLDDALNFLLGCHPGRNTASFVSGVGVKSTIPAYCANRADWSYIPGGVCSGTELIAPDFPELLEFPFLWQQLEYVLGGGSSRFLFLTLAVRSLTKD